MINSVLSHLGSLMASLQVTNATAKLTNPRPLFTEKSAAETRYFTDQCNLIATIVRFKLPIDICYLLGIALLDFLFVRFFYI